MSPQNKRVKVPRIPIKQLCFITPYCILFIWATLRLIQNQSNCGNDEVRTYGEYTKTHQTMADIIQQQTSMTAEIENMFVHMMPDVEESKNKSRRLFVYVCDEKCEVTGQYEYGLVSTYLLSMLFNRRFAIKVGNECSIFSAYRPNLYDWEVKEDDVNSRTVIDLRELITDNTDFPSKSQQFQRDLEMMDLNKEYPADVVYFHGNNDWINEIRRHYKTYTSIPWVHVLPYSDIIRLVNTGLLRLSSNTLQRSLNNALSEQVGVNQLVCFHGHLNSKNAKPILSYLEDNYVKSGYVFYFAFTSNTYNTSIEEIFRNKVIMLDSNVINAGRQCPGVYKTVLDEHILRLCHVFITMDTPLGIRAAHLRGDSNGLFCYSDTGIVHPCKRELMRVSFRTTTSNVM